MDFEQSCRLARSRELHGCGWLLVLFQPSITQRAFSLITKFQVPRLPLKVEEASLEKADMHKDIQTKSQLKLPH
jgi:hypothetical protein